MRTVSIGGNTFPVRAEIKALGGVWDAKFKVWEVPEANRQAALALVKGAPKQAFTAIAQQRPTGSARYYGSNVDGCGTCRGRGCDDCR